MKKFLVLFFSIFICSIAHADTETINWYVDETSYATTTCQTGGDIILPTTPTKYGYTFQGWANYIPIEYLESTGNQYIDTGIYPNGLIRMKAKIQTLRNAGVNSAFSGVIYPNRTSGEIWQVIYPYNGVDFNVSQEEIIFNQNYLDIQDFDVDQVNRKIELNGVTKNMNKTPLALEPGHFNIPLCKYQNEINPSSNYWYGKVYFVKIWDNNTIVRDFIPVLDSNNTPCMYDKVSNTFFYNQGTGNFIAGPVINQ